MPAHTEPPRSIPTPVVKTNFVANHMKDERPDIIYLVSIKDKRNSIVWQTFLKASSLTVSFDVLQPETENPYSLVLVLVLVFSVSKAPHLHNK